jgi:uncharacterized phiE125 gp8 family phage protein
MTALTLDDLKNYLRYEIDDTDQDVALNLILKGGQSWIERYTGLLLTQREVTQSSAAFGDYIDLRYGPYLADSLTIGYLDAAGATQTLDAFQASVSNGATRIYPAVGATWPDVGTPAGITLTYTAGYADPDDAPEVLLYALGIFAAMGDDERAGGDSTSWGAIKALLEDFHCPVIA